MRQLVLLMVVVCVGSCAESRRGALEDAGVLLSDAGQGFPDTGAMTGPAPDVTPAVAPDAAASCLACTDPAVCCAGNKTHCYGDPDKGVVCTCVNLWDCSTAAPACTQELQTPTASGFGSGWTCTWTPSAYTCHGAQQPSTSDPGWSCTTDATGWTCTTAQPPTPCNRADGPQFWSCTADNGLLELVCQAK